MINLPSPKLGKGISRTLRTENIKNCEPAYIEVYGGERNFALSYFVPVEKLLRSLANVMTM